jgi:hypothetical protein
MCALDVEALVVSIAELYRDSETLAGLAAKAGPWLYVRDSASLPT